MTNLLGDACKRGILVNLFMSNPALVSQIEWGGGGWELLGPRCP